ncbi:MAG: TIGR01777 family protein [Chlorobiaceae bacterium]|nr:TIGR01777 family protein [Chlorobiaceae bacterium]
MQGHIVVTGATGIIGSELVRKLVSRGEQVVIFARSPDAAAEKTPGAARYVRWDSFMDKGDWTGYIDGARAVIHLAGKPLLDSRWNDAHKKECYDSRIQGTRHIASAIAQAAGKPEVFISSSAIGYYGSFDRCSDTADLLETGPQGDDFLAKICIDWEKESIPAEKHGVRVVLLRTGIVLSTKGGMLQKMLMPFNFFLGGPIGSGAQCISWVHIDDEISCILEALDNKEYSGPINIVSPEPVSMKQFAAALGEVLGRPSLFPVPKLAVQLLMGEGAEYAVKGQKVKPGFLVSHRFSFGYPALSDALSDLVRNGK